MAELIAIGEALIDFTPNSTDNDGYPTITAHPGGAPANFLAALVKFGIRSALFAKVGDDMFGHLLKRTMVKAGIDDRGIVIDPKFFTTLAFVSLDANGDRSFSFARKPGADTQLEFSELDISMLDEAKALHFGTLSLTQNPSKTTTQKLINLAKSQNKLVTFDPNLRLPLWDSPEEAKEQILWGLHQADIVKISEDEINFLFACDEKAGAEKIIRDFGCKLVFATLGKRGCYFLSNSASGYVDNFNDLKTVDTTGAGDIFGGTAIAGVLQTGYAPESIPEDKLREIVKYACAAASLSTTKYGGITSVPDKEDVEKLIRG